MNKDDEWDKRKIEAEQRAKEHQDKLSRSPDYQNMRRGECYLVKWINEFCCTLTQEEVQTYFKDKSKHDAHCFLL